MEDDIIRKRSVSQGASTLERARAKARATRQAEEELALMVDQVDMENPTQT